MFLLHQLRSDGLNKTIPLEHQLIGKERLKMVADSVFRQGVPYDAVGLDKYSTSLLAALDIKESKQRYRYDIFVLRPAWISVSVT